MPSPSGVKEWRRKYDATSKLGCNLQLNGDHARAVIEFMEAEDLPSPASAIRVLCDMALSTYPEWAAGAAVRRAIAADTRAWVTSRFIDKLREVIQELEVGIQEDLRETEMKAIETAMDATDPTK